MTKNQYYSGLNKRYDSRVSVLFGLGFRQETNEFGVFWTRKRNGKRDIIAAAKALHADKRAWIDELAQKLTTGSFH